MHFRLQLITVADDGTEYCAEITDIVRAEPTLETVGLTLNESKHVLQQVQQTIVDQQVAAYLDQERACPHCGKQRHLKQTSTAPFRTLFGLVSVPNPRWQQCACQPTPAKTFRPLAALLPERSSPELRYLETKWAALAAYGVTSKLLHEVLPIDRKHSVATVRNHTLTAARRKEQELGAEQPMFMGGCQAERDRCQGRMSLSTDHRIKMSPVDRFRCPLFVGSRGLRVSTVRSFARVRLWGAPHSLTRLLWVRPPHGVVAGCVRSPQAAPA